MMLSSSTQDRKYQKGFTLVELMVSVALFSIVVTISMGTLITMIDANNKAQSLYSVMTNLSFAVDSMTRNIRTGYQYYCVIHSDANVLTSPLPTVTKDCAAPQPGIALIFKRELDGKYVTYHFNDPPGNANGWIEQRIDNGAWQRITADDVNITRLMFRAVDTTPGDNRQARVTMLVEGNVVGQRGAGSEFSLQTTVMQQIIDY